MQGHHVGVRCRREKLFSYVDRPRLSTEASDGGHLLSCLSSRYAPGLLSLSKDEDFVSVF